ncbi:MAG TPA: cbb3-type cytochrome c oxidase subunit I, partial [Thermomicrobiaceae bacterium]|nr:cbb3-type cytochrome c oxidase subunit I [Thermomicrobiaceae bacterium]
LFAFPSLTATNIMLLLDRQAGTHFFDPAAGGNPLLWQHLFWFFGHPEVYIVFLPAAEIVSSIVPVFSGRPITAYLLLVLALIATGFLSFGVWVHHMFATGLSTTSLSFFSAASMVISIPSGIQVFCWITTIWNGRLSRKTPLLFAAGFIIVFVTGGISGVMFAVVPFDQAETGSYFVVAHLHFVIAASAIFPVFGGIYYWFPKITGRMYHERAGIVSFWFMLIGFILTFFPMHITGLEGMPRRVYTYPAGMGWEIPNIISTAGSALLGFGIAVFLLNVLWSLRNGEAAGNNPWNGSTLEWLTTSPPPPYNFLEIPTIHGRTPMWGPDGVPGGPPNITFAHREMAQLPLEREADQPGQPELDEIPHRETVATSMVDSELERMIPMPEESTWPFMLALSLLFLFIGFIGPVPLRIFVVIGLGSGLISVAGWLWPREARA